MELELNNQQARHLILDLQGLTTKPHLQLGPQGLYDLICQLGFVQIDSIQWVERAHHMILFARNQTYRPHHLTQLIEEQRLLFEHWTHDASIIPSQFYPQWKHRFARKKEKLAKKFSQWQGKGYIHRCPELLEFVETHGSIRSRDVERKEKTSKEMWQWHDGKAALEYLWHIGELAIIRREGFQKVYGMAQGGVPKAEYKKTISHDQFIDWACRSALDRLGFGSPTDIAKFWDLLSIQEVKDWLSAQKANTIAHVVVQGARQGVGHRVGQGADRGQEKHLFGRPDLSSVVTKLAPVPKRVRVLSPFDPVIRDRNRLSWLFDFDYRIEIYVPEAKRKWGYYVFPLLEGQKLIGRIDMRAERKKGALVVKKLWLEKGVKLSKARHERINAELSRYLKLLMMDQVVWQEGALEGLL